jgi:O-acetyl-ADP-ribose deacetylase (regulator of RNase III)
MSSSAEHSHVKVRSGNLLDSQCHALVNTVNTVGIMGKGIALAFKKRYPAMYEDYVRRCDQGEVQLGRPYVYNADDHLIVNFPTKKHWRAVSRLDDIVKGLEYLEAHYKEWGIRSIAVPPLGCGNGQLEWDVVGPTLFRHLSRLEIPVELYAPHDVTSTVKQLSFLDADPEPALTASRFVEPQWVAIVAILDRIERQPYHWPVGRVFFQKLVYFATQAGLPTGLLFEAGSFGPFSSELKRATGRLQDNGLAVEVQRGRMFEVRVGPTYRDAVERFRDELEPWRNAVDRATDLLSRLDTHSAEVAASVHFAAHSLSGQLARRPRATEVIAAVEEWKIRRRPPLEHEEIVRSLVVLALQKWIDVELDEDLAPLIEDLIVA